MRRRRTLLGAALSCLLVLGSCGAAESDRDAQPSSAPAGHGADDAAGELSGELTVFAAASLGVVFEDIADLFTEQHPQATVRFSFAGSSDLVAQLDAGAPADVLATADESTMAAAVEAETIAGAPEVFADNVLTLAVPSGNPAGVTGFDESLDDAVLVICAPQVPCGAATLSLTELLGITLAPASEEGSVTDVLGKVTSGQADAGLVYTTDAVAAGDNVETIAVDRADEVVNHYPVAVAAETHEAELATAWVEFLRGPEAQEVLRGAGFGVP